MLSLPHTCKSSMDVLWSPCSLEYAFLIHIPTRKDSRSLTLFTPPTSLLLPTPATTSSSQRFSELQQTVSLSLVISISPCNIITGPLHPHLTKVITCLNALSIVEYTDLAPTGSLHNFTHCNRWYTAYLNQCYSHFNRCFYPLSSHFNRCFYPLSLSHIP